MIRWILRRSIDQFERDWNNETTRRHNTIDANRLAAWLVSRVIHLIAAALIGALGLAVAVAQVSDQPRAVTACTLPPKRVIRGSSDGADRVNQRWCGPNHCPR